MKNSHKNILLLLGSCLLFFLVVEAAFRVLHIFMDAQLSPTQIKDLPYENTPNGWFVRYEPVNGWVLYKHNSLGMRDLERKFEKPPGVKRIVCLGDSVVYGGEVPFEDIFTQQLEKRLNSSYSFKTEVLNCGISSYSLAEYPVYLKHKGLKFKPDIVIVGLCLNDYVSLFREKKNSSRPDGEINLNKRKRADEFIRKIKRFLFHSYFMEYIQKSLVTLRKIRRDTVEVEYTDMFKEESWKKKLVYMKELKEICKRNKAEILFVIFPVAEQFDYLKGDPRPQVYIRRILASLGIPCLDLRDQFKRSIDNGEIMYSRLDRVHFMSGGHRMAAYAAADKIEKLGLLRK